VAIVGLLALQVQIGPSVSARPTAEDKARVT
jgi:hypothetical protein